MYRTAPATLVPAFSESGPSVAAYLENEPIERMQATLGFE